MIIHTPHSSHQVLVQHGTAANSIPECLQKVHERFCSIYRPNIDPHFEKYVAIIDQNHKVSEKYEHGRNLAKIKQENDLQAGKMSRFYG